MFGFFKKKDPIEKMEKEHLRLLQESRDISRTGDLRKSNAILAQAEELAERIAELKMQRDAKT